MSGVIYCISGLGTDEKIFSRFKVNGYRLIHLPWLKPRSNESIKSYAARMAAPIHHASPVLLGVSFGGMMAIEIAKQLPVKKVIIISSVKTLKEIPGWMRIAGKWRINKIVPVRSYNFTKKIDNRRLGVSCEEELKLVEQYRKMVDPVYMDWAIHQVLNWKNEWHPENIVHIHGAKDKIFPIRSLKGVQVVAQGTHMMIYNRPNEVSELLEKELKNSLHAG